MALPQSIIQLADAIAGLRDTRSEEMAVSEYLGELRGWMVREGDFWVSDEDLDTLQRATALVDEVERLAHSRTQSREDWARRLVEAAALLTSYTDRLRAAREHCYFFKIPCLDQLAVVAIAILSKRGKMEAMLQRLPAGKACLQSLAREVERLRSKNLPDLAAFEKGLKQVDQGLHQLQLWVDGQASNVKEATRQLLEGGRLLEPLFQAQQKRDSIRTGLRDIDAQLSPLALAAAEGDEALWQQALERFLEQGEAIVVNAWNLQRNRLLVPSREWDFAVRNWDQVLVQLQEALRGGQRKSIWKSLKQLEETAARAQRRALPLNSAAGTVLEAPVQALAGALKGEIPQVMLLEVVRAFADPAAPPGTQRIRLMLEHFLRDPQPQRLLEALEMSLELVTEMSRPSYALKGLVCQCCGQSYCFGSEDNFCMEPGRGHIFLNLCA